MGTRSLTYVYDEMGNKITNMYRQFDGYPTGHGQELAEFLNIVGDNHNGAGCLAAQLVAHFKKEPLHIYLYHPDVEDCGQDYEYHIYTQGKDLSIKIMNCGWNVFGETQDDTYEPLFEGNLNQFTKYCSCEKYGDIEINSEFKDSDLARGVLKLELMQKVLKVVFQKQDGSERTMNCTLNEDIVPPLDTTVVKQKRIQNPDVLAVWDIDNNGWRSFRFDSVKSIAYPSVA